MYPTKKDIHTFIMEDMGIGPSELSGVQHHPRFPKVHLQFLKVEDLQRAELKVKDGLEMKAKKIKLYGYRCDTPMVTIVLNGQNMDIGEAEIRRVLSKYGVVVTCDKGKNIDLSLPGHFVTDGTWTIRMTPLIRTKPPETIYYRGLDGAMQTWILIYDGVGSSCVLCGVQGHMSWRCNSVVPRGGRLGRHPAGMGQWTDVVCVCGVCTWCVPTQPQHKNRQGRPGGPAGPKGPGGPAGPKGPGGPGGHTGPGGPGGPAPPPADKPDQGEDNQQAGQPGHGGDQPQGVVPPADKPDQVGDKQQAGQAGQGGDQHQVGALPPPLVPQPEGSGADQRLNQDLRNLTFDSVKNKVRQSSQPVWGTPVPKQMQTQVIPGLDKESQEWEKKRLKNKRKRENKKKNKQAILPKKPEVETSNRYEPLDTEGEEDGDDKDDDEKSIEEVAEEKREQAFVARVSTVLGTYGSRRSLSLVRLFKKETDKIRDTELGVNKVKRKGVKKPASKRRRTLDEASRLLKNFKRIKPSQEVIEDEGDKKDDDTNEENEVDKVGNEDIEVEPGSKVAGFEDKSEEAHEETEEKLDNASKKTKIYDIKDDENDDKMDDETAKKSTDDLKLVEGNLENENVSEPSVSLLDKTGSGEDWLGETQHTQYTKTGFGQGLKGLESEELMDSQASSVSVQSGFMGGPDFLGVEAEELEVQLKAQKIKALMEGNQMSSSQS